jgi:hypothetical protein
MMSKLHSNEKGFGAVEGLLIVAVVVLLGVVGYMVYHNHNKTATTTPTATNNTTSTTPTKTTTPTTTPTQPATSYFTIKEWGVRAPYTGQDTFTYRLSNGLATVISKQLAAKDAGCTTYGAGQIRRLSPTDGTYSDGTGPTVEQTAQSNPGIYAHVGSYYYQFVHDQGECGNTSVADQNQANDAVKALVASFQAVLN